MRIIALCVALLVLGVFIGWLLDSFGDSAGWAIVSKRCTGDLLVNTLHQE
jgi:F0F1-type ATP synthase assembly protein I